MTDRSNLIHEDVSAADKKKIDDLFDQLEKLIPLHFLSTDEKAALAKPGDEQLAALQPLFELAAKNKELFNVVYDDAETKADLDTHALSTHLTDRIARLAEGVLGLHMLVRSDLARTGENVYDLTQRYPDRLPNGSDSTIEPARKFYGRRARRRAP